MSELHTAARRAIRDVRPLTPDELHGYCRSVLRFHIPRCAWCEGFSAPFDYLCHAFFETEEPRDCVVWANRGGGKTQLGALATFLDLLFKPGIQIRILGGSLEQSSKMYQYLRELVERDEFRDLIRDRITQRRIALTNGSVVEILSQSEHSVRGQRVQKLRCDEVELFTPEVWQAAQFVTRSAQCGDVYVPGCIEALSTMHRPFGLMNQLVHETGAPRRIFRWSLLEVLERCPPEERDCEKCSLQAECTGRARQARGFFTINDAIQQKSRSSRPAWEAEMLCRRPSRSDCVYEEFDEEKHVCEVNDAVLDRGQWIGGMDFGYRSPTVMLWGVVDEKNRLFIIDEYVVSLHTIAEHIAAFKRRDWPHPDWLGIDPAGHQRHEHTGTSTAALLRRAGYSLRARRLQIRPGVEAVRQRLQSADGKISLFIHPRCTRLREAMRTYHYPADRPDANDPIKDGPDHACDALRYLITNLDRPDGTCDYVRYA